MILACCCISDEMFKTSRRFVYQLRYYKNYSFSYSQRKRYWRPAMNSYNVPSRGLLYPALLFFLSYTALTHSLAHSSMPHLEEKEEEEEVGLRSLMRCDT